MVSSFGPKYQRKIWQISALESKKWSNQQNKGIFLWYYMLHIITWAIFKLKCIIECLYLMIWPLFRFLGRNLSNFFVGFLENLRHQKDILKLTDLYVLLISGHSIPSVNLAYMLQYVLKGDLFNFWESIEFFRLLPWFPSKFVPNA